MGITLFLLFYLYVNYFVIIFLKDLIVWKLITIHDILQTSILELICHLSIVALLYPR
jgi:hypothetical protein